MSGTEFKTRELERLLSEGKITIDQYLDAKYRVSTSSTIPKAQEASPPKELTASPSTVSPFEKKRKSRSRALFGIVLCVLVLTVAFLIAIYANTANAENLDIEGYNFDLLLTKAQVSFQIKNIGSTDIHILSAKLNGCTNQYIPGLSASTPALDGNLDLKSGESGVANVYLPPYLYEYLSTLIPMTSDPTQEQMDNAISEIRSTSWKFTFVTETNHEYSFSVPDLGESLVDIWLSSLTIGFMGTEEVKITNVIFDMATDTATLTVKNTGSTDVVLTEAYVSNAGTSNIPADGILLVPGATDDSIQITGINYNQGYSYQFKVVTTKGNSFVFTATAPTN